jgi:hypothetical protein
MPKDYADTSGIMQGAQMALQSFGIKNQKDQQAFMQKMEDRKMLLQEKKDQREMNSAEMASKITDLKYRQAETQQKEFELDTNKRMLERQVKEQELLSTKLKMINRTKAAETFDMPGTENDNMNALARDLILSGQGQQVFSAMQNQASGNTKNLGSATLYNKKDPTITKIEP